MRFDLPLFFCFYFTRLVLTHPRISCRNFDWLLNVSSSIPPLFSWGASLRGQLWLRFRRLYFGLPLEHCGARGLGHFAEPLRHFASAGRMGTFVINEFLTRRLLVRAVLICSWRFLLVSRRERGLPFSANAAGLTWHTAITALY